MIRACRKFVVPSEQCADWGRVESATDARPQWGQLAAHRIIQPDVGGDDRTIGKMVLGEIMLEVGNDQGFFGNA